MNTRARACRPRSSAGFTFVEALVTIAILGIMASVLISAFSSVSADANKTIARQQQAAIQSAINAWVNGDSNRMSGVKPKTVEEIRTDYNSRTTSKARLLLVGSYLDADTLAHFDKWTFNVGQIKSEALDGIKAHITLPDWIVSVGYPQVQLQLDTPAP